MADDFETQIDKFIINTRARLEAVVKQSLRDTVFEAQTTIYDGGKMRVKTGFLRASGGASLESMPFGPSRGDKEKTYTWDSKPFQLVLDSLKIGDTFYFGWTANYAKYREAYDGFVEGALQNWQKKVDAVVAQFKNKDMGK